MNKDISFGGLTTVPSDYECADGDLAAVLNLVPEDGSLKPVQPPTTIMTLGTNCTFELIHKTNAFTHYIILDKTNAKLMWCDAEDDEHTLSEVCEVTLSTYKGLSAVGNTLVVLDDAGVFYVLWKDSAYKNLGSRPSPIRAEVRVGTTLEFSDSYELANSEYYDLTNYVSTSVFDNLLASDNMDAELYIDSEKKSGLLNTVFALLNQMVHDASKDGNFCHPFFLRLAYRLFDGSHIMMTAPHLIMPSSTGQPLLFLIKDSSKIRPFFLLPKSRFALNIKDVDEDWKDIITHIDVLATTQIYGYTLDNTGFDAIKRAGEKEEQVFTLATINSNLSVLTTLRPKLLTMLGDGFYKPYLLTSNTKSNKLFNPGDTIAYVYAHTKGEPSNFMVYAICVGEGSSKTAQLPTITPSEALALGLPIPTENSEQYKIYKVDADTLSSVKPPTGYTVNGQVEVVRTGNCRKSYVYCCKSTKETFDVSTALAINFKRDDEKKLTELIEEANGYHLLYDKLKYEDFIGTADGETLVSPDFGEKDVENISVKETVDDDYRSGDNIISNYAFEYNNRLNLSVKSIIPSKGDDTAYIYDYGYSVSNEEEYGDDEQYRIVNSYVEIYENYTRVLVPLSTEFDVNVYGKTRPIQCLSWFFYPNTNAQAAYFVRANGEILKLKLHQHDFLNGAYAYNSGYSLEELTEVVTKLPTADGESIPVGNKIYTSEVSNPFYFPLSGINTVGTGNIIGICSAVKALSQGQFGQFPLYAFTDEGVWALEVSTSGTYSAKQPVTRDVCINADSITQLDSSVLFATDRGLMIIEGSQTVCLSDILNGNNILSIGDLPKMESVAKLAGFTLDDFELIPFMDFVKDCRSVYDYTHQRIIVYNPSCTYAYIYSQKSKKWGMMQSTINDNVNSYPDALAVLTDGKLVNFCEDADGDYKGIAVTRPFKLDAPDVMKTVSSIIQRGYFRKGHVQCVLYASRDLFNWFVVWSSQDHYLRGFSGTPYKYYRLALVCTLADDEELAGCSVDYDIRQGTRQS